MPRAAFYTGSRLARVCQYFGLQQRELAALLGISKALVHQLEAGRHTSTPLFRPSRRIKAPCRSSSFGCNTLAGPHCGPAFFVGGGVLAGQCLAEQMAALGGSSLRLTE